MKPIHSSVYPLLAGLLLHGASNAQGTHNQSNNSSTNTNQKEPVMSTQSYQQTQNQLSATDNGSTQANKELIRKLYEQSFNARNMPLLKVLVAEDYIGAGGEKGPAAFEAAVIAPLVKAFPDIQYHIEDLIGEGDRVCVRWKWTGTHLGQFRNFAPTGRMVSNEGMAIFQCRDGKIVNASVQTDRLGFLQEMNVLPVDLSQLSDKKEDKGAISFIDKFFVPAAAKNEFYQRMKANRDFIKTLPGFIKDNAYEHTDENGNLICVTVAIWTSQEAMTKAREVVQAEYKRTGFDMQSFLQKTQIRMDRGVYSPVAD